MVLSILIVPMLMHFCFLFAAAMFDYCCNMYLSFCWPFRKFYYVWIEKRFWFLPRESICLCVAVWLFRRLELWRELLSCCKYFFLCKRTGEVSFGFLLNGEIRCGFLGLCFWKTTSDFKTTSGKTTSEGSLDLSWSAEVGAPAEVGDDCDWP